MTGFNKTFYFVGLVYDVVIVRTKRVPDQRTTWKVLRAAQVELKPIVEQPQQMQTLAPTTAPDAEGVDE